MFLGGKITSWRVIDTDLNHPYYVTAADEALAISCSEYGAQNTIHFYRREPAAISLGYFRKVAEDIDIDMCNKLGIKIVRRTSGGGSIYTDKNQLILGIISSQAMGADVEDSFERTCAILINALGKCGITASYKPPNDVLINGKKVSGSALVKKKNAYITHSTIILKLDQTTINRVLKQSKPGYVSSIIQEYGSAPKFEDLKNAILASFRDEFDMDFEPGKFSNQEQELIQELIKTKYGNQDWNFKR